MKNKLDKHEKERLSNRIVFFSSCVILYALLVLFIKNMAYNTGTVEGALALMEILVIVSLAGAMGCAAWSAYKEKKGYYLYSGMFLFVAASMTLVRYINSVPDDRAFSVIFTALAIAFVLGQAYYYLKVGSFFEKNFVKIIYIAVVICAVLFLVIMSLPKDTIMNILYCLTAWI